MNSICIIIYCLKPFFFHLIELFIIYLTYFLILFHSILFDFIIYFRFYSLFYLFYTVKEQKPYTQTCYPFVGYFGKIFGNKIAEIFSIFFSNFIILLKWSPFSLHFILSFYFIILLLFYCFCSLFMHYFIIFTVFHISYHFFYSIIYYFRKPFISTFISYYCGLNCAKFEQFFPNLRDSLYSLFY